MSDLPPMKEFPRRGRAGRRASAAAVLNHNPGESWTPDTVHRLNIDGGSGRRFSIAQIPEADEHKNSLEDLHLLPEKKMDYSLYPAMPADMHDSDDEKRVRKEKKSSFSEGGRRMSKRLSVVVSILMRGSISNKGTKNSVTEEQIIKVAPSSHHVEIEDEAEELHHPDVHYTCSDIWQHLRQFIPWILTVTSVLQICLYILDRDEFFRLLVFSPYRIVEVWRLFTYTLLHQNAIHLALNVVIQIFLGIPLEHEQGHLRVLMVYFGGAVAGALGTSVFEPNILLIGSSAGIYSVLISHIPHTVMNFKHLSYRYYRIICVVILCTSDIIYTLIHVAYGDLPKIGISAHILGAISGLLLGLALLKSATERGSTFRRVKIATGAIYVAWLLGSFIGSLTMSHASRT